MFVYCSMYCSWWAWVKLREERVFVCWLRNQGPIRNQGHISAVQSRAAWRNQRRIGAGVSAHAIKLPTACIEDEMLAVTQNLTRYESSRLIQLSYIAAIL